MKRIELKRTSSEISVFKYPPFQRSVSQAFVAFRQLNVGGGTETIEH
jgi:hypothetical protein